MNRTLGGHPQGEETGARVRVRKLAQNPRWASDRSDRLSDVLQVFARLEADSTARRNPDFFSGAGIAADAAFARLHLKDPEAPELDALAALHGSSHRVE